MVKKDSGRSVTLVGAGSLAHAFAKLLPKAGYRIDEIVVRDTSESVDEAERLARATKARPAMFETASWNSSTVWIAVSDRAIAPVAERIGPLTDWKGKVVFHSSGALASTELRSLKRRGATVASAHPMMTFVPGRVPNVTGVAWTIEGDARATSVARAIVQATNGVPLPINIKHKPLYHAFGAFLSPLLVVHLETASQLASAAGIPRRYLSAVMRPIVEQTVENYFKSQETKAGAGEAFSGPLIRGDVETIQGHIRALRGIPAALNLYRSLISAALRIDLPVKNKAAIANAIRSK